MINNKKDIELKELLISDQSQQIETFSKQAQNNIESTERIILVLKDEMQMLHMNSADKQFRDKIKQQLQFCSNNFIKVKQNIQQLQALQLKNLTDQENRRNKCQIIVKHFEEQKSKLKTWIQEFKRIESLSINSQRYSINFDKNHIKQDDYENNQQEQKLEKKVKYQELLLDERQSQLNEIENLMEVIEDLFEDLYSEAVKQDVGLKIISSNIKSAKKKGQETNVILQEAQVINKDTNKQTMLLAGCIVFFVLLLILLVSAGRKSPPPDQTQEDYDESVYNETHNTGNKDNIPPPVRILLNYF